MRHQMNLIHNTVCSRLKSHHQITMMTNILLLWWVPAKPRTVYVPKIVLICNSICFILQIGVLCELHGNSYEWKACQQDASYPALFHVFTSSDFSLPKNCQAQHIHLCAKHGKSRHTAVWPMTNVANSNANLIELDPNKMRNGSFVVPEEGIFVGLCGKIVVMLNQK